MVDGELGRRFKSLRYAGLIRFAGLNHFVGLKRYAGLKVGSIFPFRIQTNCRSTIKPLNR